MWACLLRWVGFAPRGEARLSRVPAPSVERQQWTGTILSTETYR